MEVHKVRVEAVSPTLALGDILIVDTSLEQSRVTELEPVAGELEDLAELREGRLAEIDGPCKVDTGRAETVTLILLESPPT